MPLTFHWRFTIIPGFLYLNINRRSWSWTTAAGPVRHTRSSTGRRTTSVNLPGKGLGYRHTTTAPNGRHRAADGHRGMTEEEREYERTRAALQSRKDAALARRAARRQARRDRGQ
jgi:hypothetical protein